MPESSNSVRKNVWVNIIFFAVTSLVGLIGTPLCFAAGRVSFPDIVLFLFYMTVTAISITAGYHRLFSHVTYRAHPLVRFFFLFFGAAAFEQTALDWSSQHRDHHRFVDTDLDPYSIKKGFWYAHIGWLVFWKHQVHYDNAPDLQKDALVMHQHKNYLLWSATSGIILPVLIGALWGHALTAFVLSVCLRLTLVYHSTFCINSVCHMFGRATYDIHATARDHWIIALATFGEGYHNFHHRFPGDYRNGVRWYHWDPSKWLIRFLAFLGLAGDLRRVSSFRIIEARLAGEHSRAEEALGALRLLPGIREVTFERFQAHYLAVKKQLSAWDAAAKDYQELCHRQVAERRDQVLAQAQEKLKNTREAFLRTREQWKALVRLHPVRLQALLQK